MKTTLSKIKIATLLLIVANVNVLYSQSIKPLLSEGKQWNVLYNEFCGPMQPEKYITTCYKLEGDTLLDGVSYKLMHSTIYENLTHWSLNSILREEDNKVYYRQYLTDESFADEKLLYDFSLQPGDSIRIDLYDDYLVLDSVCNIVVGNDTLKKYCFYYSIDGFHSDDKEFWIEGIGSECGVLHVGDVTMVGGNNTLLCYFYNDELLWHNEYFDTCYYTNLNVNENEIDKISVYPNPTTQKIIIEGVSVANINVYDSAGRLIMVKKGNDIDVKNIPQGVYVLSIISEDGMVFNKNIIVK